MTTNDRPPSTHRIDLSDIDRLANAEVSGAASRRVRAIEISRRILFLRALADAASDHALAQSMDFIELLSEPILLLERIRERNPDIVANLLGYPSVGVWETRLVRSLRSASGDPTEAVRKDIARALGYLSALAATALVTSGLSGEIRAPVHNNVVSLPTLGEASFEDLVPDEWAWVRTSSLDQRAVIEFGNQAIQLPIDLRKSSPGWRPLPVARLASGERAHPIVLDDSLDSNLDFQEGSGDLARRLTAEEARLWMKLLTEAGDFLADRHEEDFRLVTRTIDVIAPLPIGLFTVSTSHTEGYGGILASLPKSSMELAETLVHEARHSALNALLHQARLLKAPAEPDGAEAAMFYAPWRSDPRPTVGLLHGIYAFTGVAAFLRRERQFLTGAELNCAYFDFAVHRGSLLAARSQIADFADFTPLGRRFIAAVGDQIDDWKDEPLPREFSDLAVEELLDRYSMWRIRHLQPPPALVRKIADGAARTDVGAGVPALARLVSSSVDRGAPDLRWILRRSRISSPVRGWAESITEISPNGRGSLTRQGDIALIDGDYRTAQTEYADSLTENPDDQSAWVGLGLAIYSGSGGRLRDDAATGLLLRPELVRAVYLDRYSRAGADTDPLVIAAQIGRELNVDGPQRHVHRSGRVISVELGV